MRNAGLSTMKVGYIGDGDAQMWTKEGRPGACGWPPNEHSVPPCPFPVERRRRDKINNWIVQLSKIIPDCSVESTKSGQVQGAPGWVGCLAYSVLTLIESKHPDLSLP